MKRFLNRKVAIVAAVFCLISAFEGTAFGQTNRISGQVYAPGRQPLADAYVELQNEMYSVISRTKTNGSGLFSFVGVSSGRFKVLVRPFGTDYEEQSQDVEIINVVRGGRASSDSVNIDVYLKQRKAAFAGRSATGVIFAQEIPPTASKSYERALTEFAANRKESGMTELRAALGIFPDYFLANERLGVELLNMQKFAEAKLVFEKAVAINPKSSNCWYGLAYARYIEDKPAVAVDAAKKAADLAPDSADISLMLGVAYRKNKEYTDAEKSMLRAKKLSGNKLADASWNLALLYVYNIKDNRRAADELENYLKIRPDHPNANQLKKLISQFRGA